MSEQEFNENVQRELSRIQLELRLQDERLANQEIRIKQLENRVAKQVQRMTHLEARYDQVVHKQNLIMRYIGLTDEDLEQLLTNKLHAKYLLYTVGRREN